MIQTWENLVCACGSEQFVQVLYVRWREGQGSTAMPAGYECVSCHKHMDAAKLIADSQLRNKRKELQQLEQEIGGKHADSGRGALSGQDDLKR